MSLSAAIPSPTAHPLGQTWFGRLANLATLGLLILILVISTGEMVHGQLLKFGELVFSDPSQKVQYFLLRADPEPPTCNPHVDVEQEIARQAAANAAPGGPGPGGSGKADELDDLLGAKTFDADATRASLKATVQDCAERHALYTHIRQHITPQLKLYRGLETSFFALFKFGADNRAMILLTLLTVTAAFTTLGFHHISLRPARRARDFQAQSWSMLAASLLMLYSCVRYYQISVASGVEVEDPHIHFGWMTMFGALMLVSAWQTLRPHRPDDAHHTGGRQRVVEGGVRRRGQDDVAATIGMAVGSTSGLRVGHVGHRDFDAGPFGVERARARVDGRIQCRHQRASLIA